MRLGVIRLVVLVVLLGIAASHHKGWFNSSSPAAGAPAAGAPANGATATAPDAGDVDTAFHDHSTNVIVTASGTIARLLADDTHGLQHQRFVLRMPSGITVLVAHDIDEAPRIPDLQAGVALVAHGEYVWNAEGGIVHWTHHDSSGRHPPGWIDYQGRRYQ